MKWFQSKAYMRMVFCLSDIANVAKSFQKIWMSVYWLGKGKCVYSNWESKPVVQFDSMLLYFGCAVAILIYVFVEQTHIYADLRLIRTLSVLACVWTDDEKRAIINHTKTFATRSIRAREREREGKTKTPAQNLKFVYLFLSFSCDYFKHYIFIVCSLHDLYAWVCCVSEWVSEWAECVLVPKLLFHYSNLNFFDWIHSLHFQAPKRIIKWNEQVQCIVDDDEFTYSFTRRRLRACFVSFRSFIQAK